MKPCKMLVKLTEDGKRFQILTGSLDHPDGSTAGSPPGFKWVDGLISGRKARYCTKCQASHMGNCFATAH